MSAVMTPALVEVGLVTLRGILKKSDVDNPIPHLPLPATYTSVILVYGALGLFSGNAERFAAMVGWGLVVATALQVWTPGGKVTTNPSQKEAA